MSVFYNDNSPESCAWLNALIDDGLIPPGHVDCRPIQEIQSEEVIHYDHVHFFAGIGGWAEALRLAGWPIDRPVWTGSCPCQPLSCAGKQLGEKDERHLWPEFYRLISECRPEFLVGEQVASRIGREWLDGISLDLEELGYGVGAADLCAAGVGAPHIRQRLFWGAVRLGNSTSHDERRNTLPGAYRERLQIRGPSGNGGVDNAGIQRSQGRERAPCNASGEGLSIGQSSTARGLEFSAGDGWKQRRAEPDGRSAVGRCGIDGMAKSELLQSSKYAGPGARSFGPKVEQSSSQFAGCNFWSDSTPILCRDGKTRRIPAESALFPLADGVPGRVGLLRGAGNAIVPEVAAEFIKAFIKSLEENRKCLH